MSDAQKARLRELFEAHEPALVPKVNAYFNKYTGKEDNLIRTFEKKYGVAPGAPASSGSGAAGAGAAAAATPPAESPRDAAGGGGGSASATPRGGAAAAAGGGNYKERVTALFAKHEPEKVSKVDAFLKKFKGEEEKFIRGLEKKYGEAPGGAGGGAAAAATPPAAGAGAAAAAAPTTPPATTPRDAAPAAAAGAGGGNYKERVTALFAKHEPEKVSKVDAFLKKFKGEEEKFIRGLEKKYGEAPGGAGGGAAAGAATPPATTPRDTVAVAGGAAAASTPTGGAAAGGGTFKERLTAIFAAHDAEKVPKVDAYLKKYKGKEEQLIKQFEKQFGISTSAGPTPRAGGDAEPSPPATTPRDGGGAAAAAATPPAAAAGGGTFKERLTAIFAAHDAEKVPKVDAYLKKYKGKEEQLIKQFEKQFGISTSASPTPRAGAAAGGGEHDDDNTAPPATTSSAPAAGDDGEGDGAGGNIDDEDHGTPSQTPPSGDSAPVSGTSTPRAGTGARSVALPRADDTAVVSASEARKMARLNASRTSIAAQFYAAKVRDHEARHWLQLWIRAGRERFLARLRNSTKDVLADEELAQSLGSCNIKPEAWARVLLLRETLSLATSPRPSNHGAVTNSIDETVTAAYEFITITHDAEIRKYQEAAAAEMQAMAGVLEAAQANAQLQQKAADDATDAAKLTQMHLDDALREIENLNHQLEAQARLTSRANNTIKRLSGELDREQRGIPSEVEMRLEQKDELASHLHKQLAASRSSANTWKEQAEQATSQLAEERDRRVRAEQRVEVLSVCLVPPETLGVHAPVPQSERKPQSIAHSVRSARGGEDFHLSPHPEARASQQRSYSEQAQLLAAARKALLEEGSAIGGDVPRLLMRNRSPGRGGSSPRSETSSARGGSTSVPRGTAGNNGQPPPPDWPAPPNALRAGLNQTPAAEGAAAAAAAGGGAAASEGFGSPSPAVPRSAADDLDIPSSGFGVSCPNCVAVQLTAFNGARFSTRSADVEKVAFCFSCRKAFTRKDLDQLTSRRARPASSAAGSAARGGGQARAGGQAQQQKSVSRASAQSRVPEHLRNSVMKLASRRTVSTPSAGATSPPESLQSPP